VTEKAAQPPAPLGALNRLLSRFKIDRYLLLILATVVAASVAPARGHGAHVAGWVTSFAIGLVFFLHGARLSREAVIGGLTHWRLHAVVFTSTFVLFPLLCLGLTALPDWITPRAFRDGLIFLGCLPSTIQSSIGFTVIAHGDVAAAVASASASNLLGMGLTPALTGLLLHARGGISANQAWSIVLQLLAPFAAGQALRLWIGAWVTRRARFLSMIDRGSILLVVYTAFSGAVVEGVWSKVSALDLARLLVLCGALLGAVLWITAHVARALGFSKDEEIAIVFCGSKKSLASGAPMAGVLFPPAQAGIVLLPLMIFHQIQLMACAVIAQRYAKRLQKQI
jgi:sodium/bile acid cotransporter 7